MKWQVQVRLSHVTLEPIRNEDLTQANLNPLGEQWRNLIGPDFGAVMFSERSYDSVWRVDYLKAFCTF